MATWLARLVSSVVSSTRHTLGANLVERVGLARLGQDRLLLTLEEAKNGEPEDDDAGKHHRGCQQAGDRQREGRLEEQEPPDFDGQDESRRQDDCHPSKLRQANCRTFHHHMTLLEA